MARILKATVEVMEAEAVYEEAKVYNQKMVSFYGETRLVWKKDWTKNLPLLSNVIHD